MARIILAIVSGGEDEAQRRVDSLGEQFKSHSFAVETHDRKHQIVLTEGPNPSTPELETMKGVAQGYGGDREAEAAPHEVKQAPMPQKGPPATISTPAGNRPAPPTPTPRPLT
jgi:hypothetical protein